MAEQQTERKKAEVVQVQMEDGRSVGFAGKRKVLKETLIDESKIVVDGDTVTFAAGAVSIRMDFRNGASRTFQLPVAMLAQFAGHGAEQKYGDELAAPAEKPLSEEDMVLAVEDLNGRIQAGDWKVVREGGGGGVSGAHIVLRAIAEVSGKTIEEVKAFVQKKLDDAKAKEQKLSRKDLYDAFRNPQTKIGQRIKQLEEEKLASTSKANADDLLAELG